MYLLDTNIFLEILLQRRNRKAAKEIFAANPSAELFMTDFSLHSIGVFLFQKGKQDVYDHFVTDMIIETGVGVIVLDERDITMLGRVSKQFSLDYDDAYQYTAAEKYGLHILSFDSDFDRTEKGRRIPG